MTDTFKSINNNMDSLKKLMPTNTNYLAIIDNCKRPKEVFAGKDPKIHNILAKNSKNYAIRCKHLVCVDCDLDKNCGDINDQYKNTYTQRTAGGGYHYVYSIDNRMKHWHMDNNLGKKKYDIKFGENSYFLGAGSTTKKGIYTIYNNIPPTRMPDGLFNELNNFFPENKKKTKTKSKNNKIINKDIKINIRKSMMEINEVIAKCPDSYFQEYGLWTKIRWAMHFENNSKECLELYIKRSQVGKYKNKTIKECQDLWYESNISNKKQISFGWLINKLKNDCLYYNMDSIQDLLLTGTHSDLADIANELIGDDYIYCEGNDSIYNWNKTYWKPISKDKMNFQIKNELIKFYKKQITKCLQKNNNPDFKELSRVFLLVKNTNHIKCVSQFFKFSIQQVEITDLNKNDYEFVFNNCCINLKTGKIESPQKKKYATLCAGYDYVESTEEKREELTEVLSTILSNKEIRDFTLLLLSTSLVGIPIAKFIIFKGAGRNGKGTLNEIMRIMMGDYYYKLNHKTLIKSKSQDRQDINNIKFKRFLLTTEPDHEGKLDSNLMKDICSDDKIINARALYKTDSRVPKKNTTIMECNNLPLLDNCNGQDALSERLNIIEFLSSFVSKDDKRLLLTESKRKYYVANSKYVSEEWTQSVKIALFDILLEHCIKFLKDKSIINDKPDIVKNTNSNYFLSSNEIKEWIVDNYYIGREDDIKNKRFMRSKTVLDDFKMSEMFANCSLRDKKKVLPGKWKKLMDEWFPEYYHKRKKLDNIDYNSILFGFVKKELEN